MIQNTVTINPIFDKIVIINPDQTVGVGVGLVSTELGQWSRYMSRYADYVVLILITLDIILITLYLT